MADITPILTQWKEAAVQFSGTENPSFSQFAEQTVKAASEVYWAGGRDADALDATSVLGAHLNTATYAAKYISGNAEVSRDAILLGAEGSTFARCAETEFQTLSKFLRRQCLQKDVITAMEHGDLERAFAKQIVKRHAHVKSALTFAL